MRERGPRVGLLVDPPGMAQRGNAGVPPGCAWLRCAGCLCEVPTAMCGGPARWRCAGGLRGGDVRAGLCGGDVRPDVRGAVSVKRCRLRQ